MAAEDFLQPVSKKDSASRPVDLDDPKQLMAADDFLQSHPCRCTLRSFSSDIITALIPTFSAR
jgi:hypothetical protein